MKRVFASLGIRISLALASASVIATTLPSCSQGEGSGKVAGTLNVPNCWTGPFELDADFLAGVPFREGLQLRIQSGSDFESFSDGLSILLAWENAASSCAVEMPGAMEMSVCPGVRTSRSGSNALNMICGLMAVVPAHRAFGSVGGGPAAACRS